MGKDYDCKKDDCKYHAENAKKCGGCNYMLITQKSKLSQLEPGEKYSVENCKFYDPGRKRIPVSQQPLAEKTSPQTQKGANKLCREENSVVVYDAGLHDRDIAKLYGVTEHAVAYWRKIAGIGNLRKNAKRLNWDEINAMLEEGYSDKAIARLANTRPVVISEYRKQIVKSRMKEGD